MLLITSINAIPIDKFFPFNGDKLCLIDATSGMVHTNNILDELGIPITEVNPEDCYEYRLSPNDDASSLEIDVTFPFFDKTFLNAFVSSLHKYIYLLYLRRIIYSFIPKFHNIKWTLARIIKEFKDQPYKINVRNPYQKLSECWFFLCHSSTGGDPYFLTINVIHMYDIFR